MYPWPVIYRQADCDEVNSPSIYQYLTCDKGFVKQSFFLNGWNMLGSANGPTPPAPLAPIPLYIALKSIMKMSPSRDCLKNHNHD